MLTPRTTIGRRALSALELVTLLALVAALFAGAVVGVAMRLAAVFPG